MTELFDPPMDKSDLPDLKTKRPASYCLLVGAFGLASALIIEEVVNPSINWSSMISIEATSSDQPKPETFCENVERQEGDVMAKWIGSTFCGQEP